ncbi:Ig-like domain-containing protein [Cardiobacterium hominis]|uniref:Ig-like domain-containing protein n=1 Tax=Cardiobacterium hominis TaxID=2718 RepID=UPI00370D676E
MAKQIALTLAKVKGSSNSADIIDQVSINTGNGSPVHVRAVDNVYYQLTDLETQYGPENIMTERVGNDLYVAFEGESIESPSLIIDDYYSLNPNGSKNLLVGQHENGSFYPYIPESAQQTDAVHMLADHVAAGQALGGDSSFAGVIPVEAGGAGWSPWAILGGIVALGGLSALAIAARNHDRHHHKHHDDQPQPQPNPNPQPNPQTIAPPTVAKDPTHKGGVTITPDNKATTLEIKYTDEAGQPHTIHVNKGTNGKWQADGSLPPGVVVDPNTGKVTLAPDSVKDGSSVTAKNSDGSHSSMESTVIADNDDATPQPNPNPNPNPGPGPGPNPNPGPNPQPQPGGINPPTVAKDPAHKGGVVITPDSKATTLDVNYTDEQGQSHSVSFTKDASGKWVAKGTLPGGVTIDPTTGKVTIAPEAVKDGSTVKAHNSDGTHTSPDADVITDTDGTTPPPANVDPTANADSAKGTKGQPVEIDVLANDSDPQGNHTLDPKSVKLIDPATNQPVTTLKVAGEGEWKVDPTTGKVTFTPEPTFTGNPKPVQYTVADKDGHTSKPATITVTYDGSTPPPANVDPTANADSAKGTKGQPVEVDVLANDSDPQGNNTLDPKSVKLIDPATNQPVTTLKVAGEGEWKVDPTSGKVTFTPEPTFTGNPKPVQYTVADTEGHTSKPATITVTYDGSTPPPANVDPTANADTAKGTKGQPVEVDVLANDSDPQGNNTLDPKSVKLIDPATNQPVTTLKVAGEGEWKVDPTTGKVTFTPEPTFSGNPKPVQYTVADKDGHTSKPATITVTYDGSTPPPANVDPTANADSAKGTKGQPVEVDVLANDSDPQGNNTLDPKSVKLIDPATNQPVTTLKVAGEGEWKVDPTSGKVTFTPEPTFSGNPKPVQYTVADKDGHTSKPATITVTYDGSTPQPGNDAPVANADNMKGEPGKAVEIDVLKNDTDPQGESTIDKTSVKLLDPTTGAKVTELKVAGEGEWKVDPTTGKVTFTPDPAFKGNPKPVQYVVSDLDKHESQPGTITVTYDNVTPPQPQKIEPPTVAADPDHQGGMIVTPVDKATTLTVNYTDEKDQAQTITVVKDPQTGEWKAQGTVPSDVKVDAKTGAVTLPPDEVKDGSTVVAKNGDGTLTSADASGIAPNDDGSTPVLPAPTVAADPANQGGVIITPNDKATTLTVDYTDEAGQPQHIQVAKDPADNQWKPQGQLPGKASVDPTTGKVTLPPDDVKDGSTVKAKNGDGTNESPEASATAPDDAANPPQPGNDAPVANADNMKGEPGKAVEIDVLKNDTDPQGESTIDKTSVKLLDPTTGAKVTELKVAGEGEWKVDPTTGKVTFTPDPAFKGNPKPVQYVVSDLDKHESQPGTITVTYDNVTPPQPQKIEPPTVAADPDHQGGMIVTPVDKATTLTVNYTDEKDQAQTITVVKDPQTGEWKAQGTVPSDVKVDAKTGAVTLPPDEVKDGSTVVAKNGDGTLTSADASGIAPNDDGSTPVLPAPTVAADPANQGGVIITPNDKATTLTVDYTDEAGQPQHIQVAKDPADNQWKPQGQLPGKASVDPTTGKVTLPPDDVKDGSTVKAKNGDGTNESPEASATAPDDAANPPQPGNDAPVANADNMKGEPGKAVEIDVLKNDTDPQGESTIDKTSVKLLDPTTGAKVTELKVAGEGEWKVDPTTGKVTFTPDPAFKGNPKPVQYVVSDLDKHESQPGTITVTYDNVTPPQPQKIEPPTVAADPDHQGGMIVTPVDKATTLTVNYTDEKDQAQTITVVKDPQTGEWKAQGTVPSDVKVDAKTGAVTLPPDEVKDGSTVVAKNGDGTLTSADASGIAPNDDGSTPVLPAPTVAADPANQGGVIITPNDKATTLTVDYTDEAGQPQHIQVAKDPADNQWKPQGQLPGKASVDPTTGKVTLPPDDVKDGSTVKAKNGDGTNESPEASATAPDDAANPPQPGNDAPVANADSMKGEPGKAVEIDVLKNDTDPQGESTIDKTSVKLLDPTTGAKVTELKVAGEGEWKVDPTTGKVTFTPDPAFKGNPKPVQYVVSDLDKHESQPGTITVTYDNVTPPQPQKIEPPTVAADPDHQGGMIVTPVDKATTLTVNYTDEKDQAQTITVVKDPQTGEWKAQGTVPSDVKVDAKTGAVTLPPDEVKDGSTVVAKNGDGTLTSADASGIAPNDDGSTPVLPAPTVAADPANQGGVIITPNDKATTLTVDYTDEAGQPQHIQVAKDPADNQWKPQGQLPGKASVDPTTGKVTLPPDDVKDGSTVKAKNGDGTNESPEASATAPDDAANPPQPGNDAPVANADSMKGEPGKAVEIDVLKNDTDPQGESTIDKTSVKLLDPTTGAKVTELKVAGEGEWKVDPTTGKVTFTPDPAFKGNPKPVQYVVSDLDKHESQPGTITVTYDNVTPPQPQKIEPPTVAADPDHQGGMIVTPVDKATTLTVNYTDEKDQAQTITVVKDPQTGEWKAQGTVPSDVKVDAKTGAVTLPPDEVKDGTDVTATNADEAGSVSDLASGKAPNDDGNTPSEVEVASITGDKAVEGTALTYDVTLNKVPTADTEVTLKLANGSGDVATDLGKEIEVSTDGGNTWTKVTPDADGNFKVTVPAGSTNGIKVQVPTVDDTAVEGDETIRLEGKAAKQADTVVGEGTIVDNDVTGREPPAPTVAQDPDHKGGMVITPADKADKLEVKYTDESDQPQTITVVKDPTTGEWKPEGTLPHKDITVDPKTGKVTLPPDAVKDQSDVIAENSGGGKTSEGKGTAGEDDANQPQPVEPKVSISGDENVTEGESATYKVTLDKPADKDITVTVTLKHGETSDADFSPAPEINKTLTIPAGKTEVEFKLNTVDDKQAEGKETYSLTLSEPKGAQLGDHTSVTTAINDATTPPPAIPQVKSVSSPQAEEGKALVYEVALDAPQADTPVELTLKNGTATLGTDTGSPIEVSTDGGTTWTPVTPGSDGKFTATVPAGSENGVKVRVPTVKDTETEADETLTLDAATKDQTTPATGTGTITDVPPPSAEVKSVSSPKVAEGEALVFDVAVDKPAADTEVSLTLKNGTATLGTDTGSPIEVSTDGGTTWTPVTPGSDGKFTATVPAGSENGVKVRVPTVTDTVTEQDETLTLDAATADQTTPATGTGTITDVPPVAPQAPSVAAGTEQGSVTVTPPATADKLTVTYKDEDKADHEVVVSKDPASGEWKGTDLPDGVTVDAKTGVVTIAAKAVLDNSEVKAVAAAGTLSSDEGSGTAGEDAVNNVTGEASSEAVAQDQLGLNGEFYGFNDSELPSQLRWNKKTADQVRYHADDESFDNLRWVSTMQTLVDGRNGETLVGTTNAAKAGIPDARFKSTNIKYGMDPAVSDNLGNNEKVAPGGTVTKASALYQFLNANGRSDAASLQVEEGVPNKGTSGLGFTTDSMVRVVGKVYFEGGNYDFRVYSDDGYRLMIDGKEVSKFNGNRAPASTDSENVSIDEGFHTVEMIYWEQGSNARLHMQYKEHGSDESHYKTLDMGNNLMMHPDANIDLNQLQDVHNTGTAEKPVWEVRTGATLDGGEGKDNITGSDGRDFIYGHDGNDSLTGGKGDDTFIYNTKAANGHDVIKDFKIGEDKISLTDLLDTKSIDAKTPGWKGLSEIQNAQWDDSAHKLSFDTTDAAGKTYHNSITFEGITHSYSSAEEFLKDNTHII